jgi:hypothetical protein
MKLNAMGQWGHPLTALEHKCIKYVFVGSGLAFCFYSYRRMLKEFSISKRRIRWVFIKILRVKGLWLLVSRRNRAGHGKKIYI